MSDQSQHKEVAEWRDWVGLARTSGQQESELRGVRGYARASLLTLCLATACWKAHRKGTALAFLGFDLDGTTVVLHDPVGDGKP